MTLEDAKALVEMGGTYGDAYPLLTPEDRVSFTDWWITNPDAPNLTRRRTETVGGTTMGEFCKCGGPLAQTGSCKTCQWGCGFSSGGCG